MTIIADQPANAELPVRHQQQGTVARLAYLLTLDLPVCYWTVFGTDGRTEGQADGQAEVLAWAEAIANGVFTIEAHKSGKRYLWAYGTGANARISVWTLLPSTEQAEAVTV
ncbi:hypothetical protein [Nonomuraea indica]|uniref:hypothetical protein n=1 Tax=Nonomuraea indica TaxID=1581193 RepID=UPI000C7B12B4|nr:hypothetical protein [Nonomuraea indica]